MIQNQADGSVLYTRDLGDTDPVKPTRLSGSDWDKKVLQWVTADVRDENPRRWDPSMDGDVMRELLEEFGLELEGQFADIVQLKRAQDHSTRTLFLRMAEAVRRADDEHTEGVPPTSSSFTHHSDGDRGRCASNKHLRLPKTHYSQHRL